MRDVDQVRMTQVIAESRGLDQRPPPPIANYTPFDAPRPITDWVQDGQVVKGHEPNGLALHFDALDALSTAARTGNPPEFVAIGERGFSDGRWFLDLAINPHWVRATSDFQFINRRWVYVCPECDGRGDNHRKVSIPDPSNPMKKTNVKCPRDTSSSRR